jgi:LPXTG-motif cell wall-anchored protein
VKRFTFLITLLGVLTVAQAAAALDPGPVHQCGTFVSYRAADATRGGELVIGSTTYATSSGNPTPFGQVIAPGATVGSQVCLDGTVVASQTTANLLTDFTVSPAPVASPATSAAPASSSLPSTSAQPQTGAVDATYVWLLAALAVLIVVGALIARNRRTPTP